MDRINWTRVLYHLSFWLVYLVLNAALSCIIHGKHIPADMPAAMSVEFYVLPIKILLTYFVFYYLIPLYLDRKKTGMLVGMLLLAFAVAILTYRLVLVYLIFPRFRPGVPIDIFHLNGLYLTAFDLFITLAAAITVKMIRMHYKRIEFEQQLQREKLQSELSFLRAQTNPHFLFNTLNNLYVLARKKSDKTPEAILMLSQIMRFVLYDCRAPRIRMADEARVIQDYIELEKLRYNERLVVEFSADIDNPHAKVAPLLLLPLVENAFKHGANSTTGNAEIRIRLTLRDNQLEFCVCNTAEPPKMPDGNTGGIGLKNIQRQLDLIYPAQHRLDTRFQNNLFEARLELQLNEPDGQVWPVSGSVEEKGSANITA